MPKFNVIHGSVTVGFKDFNSVVANIGDTIELTDAQAKGLIASGFITDAETFANLKSMIESAAKANALGGLDKKLTKLAAALDIRNQAAAEAQAEADSAAVDTKATKKGK
jgi:hypothetical protein